jgi:hypothetical protein
MIGNYMEALSRSRGVNLALREIRQLPNIRGEIAHALHPGAPVFQIRQSNPAKRQATTLIITVPAPVSRSNSAIDGPLLDHRRDESSLLDPCA